MHILFNAKERKWLDMSKFGCPIRKGCPAYLRKTILRKKEAINNQNSISGKNNERKY